MDEPVSALPVYSLANSTVHAPRHRRFALRLFGSYRLRGTKGAPWRRRRWARSLSEVEPSRRAERSRWVGSLSEVEGSNPSNKWGGACLLYAPCKPYHNTPLLYQLFASQAIIPQQARYFTLKRITFQLAFFSSRE